MELDITGFWVFGVGVGIAFVSFVIALSNMGIFMTSSDRTHESVIKGHIFSMFGMAVGGIISLLGFVIALIDIVTFLG